MQNLKKGEVLNDIKDYNQEKKVGEILSKNLNDIKEMYKATNNDMEEMIETADKNFDDYKIKYKESLTFSYPNVTPVGSEVMTSACLMNIMDHGKFLIGANFDIDLINQFKESVDDVQTVVAVGPDCRQVKVGDKVKIRLSDFTRRINPNTINSQEVTELPLETINNEKFLSFSERNIKYIFNS